MSLTAYNRAIYVPSTSQRLQMRESYGWKSNPRINDPINYYMRQGYLKRNLAMGPYFSTWNLNNLSVQQWIVGHRDFTSTESKQAYNKAYGRLKDLIYTNVGLGETLAEGREALSMVGDRLFQIARAAKALRRGDLRTFLTILNITPLPKHRDTHWVRKKDFAAVWLEYWLGWAPLCASIYGAMTVIDELPTRRKYEATAYTIAVHRDFYSAYGGKIYHESQMSCKVTCKIGCEVEIDNLNLFRLNQLGLVNPVSVAWALVPFSFVFEWFVDVSTWLNSFTDWLGLTVTKSYNTVYARPMPGMPGVGKGSNTLDPANQSFGNWEYGMRAMRRRTGLGSPFVVPTGLNGLSATRGLTAVALITSIFAPASKGV